VIKGNPTGNPIGNSHGSWNLSFVKQIMYSMTRRVPLIWSVKNPCFSGKFDEWNESLCLENNWIGPTSFSVILQLYFRSQPSLLKCWCGLSRMMKTMSAGILFGAWMEKTINEKLVTCTNVHYKPLYNLFKDHISYKLLKILSLDVLLS